MFGHDYCWFHKVRINALLTRSRLGRGRGFARDCSAGCALRETSNHVLQCYFRTWGQRVKRHDAIVNYLAKVTKDRSNLEVVVQPHVVTSEGVRKPDIVIFDKCDKTVYVVDVQINDDQINLDAAHGRKVKYYSDNVSFMEQITQRFNAEFV